MTDPSPLEAARLTHSGRTFTVREGRVQLRFRQEGKALAAILNFSWTADDGKHGTSREISRTTQKQQLRLIDALGTDERFKVVDLLFDENGRVAGYKSRDARFPRPFTL